MYKRLQEICKSKGTNITALCKEVTGNSGNLATWKKGYMRSDYLDKAADILGLSTDYILGRTEKSSPSELTENELEMLQVFKELTPTQQGKLIERAKMMNEQNEAEAVKKDRVS